MLCHTKNRCIQKSFQWGDTELGNRMEAIRTKTQQTMFFVCYFFCDTNGYIKCPHLCTWQPCQLQCCPSIWNKGPVPQNLAIHTKHSTRTRKFRKCLKNCRIHQKMWLRSPAQTNGFLFGVCKTTEILCNLTSTACNAYKCWDPNQIKRTHAGRAPRTRNQLQAEGKAAVKVLETSLEIRAW